MWRSVVPREYLGYGFYKENTPVSEMEFNPTRISVRLLDY